MAAHQCPRCELKFLVPYRVETHLATDHSPVNRVPPAEKSEGKVACPR